MTSLVLLGLVICVSSVAAVASMPVRPRVRRAAEADPALLHQAVDAYERQEWDAAERSFREILAQAPGHARALDYLARIELTRHDAERLASAEEALVAGDARRASQLASSVPPNSPLFAQSETVARKAREQLEHGASAAADSSVGKSFGLDVTVALGEALAQYEAGDFEEAAQRAEVLAQQAKDATRDDLLRWAQDVRRFAQKYALLPRDEANLVHHVDDAMEAVTLDQRLSDGHYARTLRERMASALSSLGQVLLDEDDAVGGCVQARQAAEFDDRNERVQTLVRRCENEAFKRISQGHALERQHPDQALKLYRQALAIAVRGSSPYRAAQSAIADLEWSEER